MTTRRIEASRFGIRARLLTLLLPAVLGLLALDSWDDHRALRDLVQAAYDQSMLASVTALRSSVSVAADGSLRLEAPRGLQSTVDATPHRHVHVGLTPRPAAQSATAGRSAETTLLGEADLPAPPASAAPASTVWYDSDYRGEPVRLVALRSEIADGRGQRFDLLVQAAEGTAPRDAAQAVATRQALLRDARMVLVVVLLVWLGVTWSLRPLEALRKSVRDNEGHALGPLDTRGVPHEVAPLVDAVNAHVARYRRVLEEQAQFLADASHQLRTPLAIMLTQAGVALREKDPTQLHETLRAIVAQVARSRRLCEQLLSLAHASDSAPPADAPTRVDLNAVAREVVLQYLTLAHEKNQDLGWTDAGPAGVPVLANAPEVHEALANLLHNAIVHTPPGGRITVAASLHEGLAQAEVRDDGPGIAQARRAEVFERFRQGGGRIGTGSHGAGLGLAIARAYARRNGGDIVLADADAHDAGARGLRAILRLPRGAENPH